MTTVYPTWTRSLAPLVEHDLDYVEAAVFATVFKALSDTVRLRLLSLIAAHGDGEVCVTDLTIAVEDVFQSTVSYHLKVLRGAGLITAQRRSARVYYRIVPEAFGGLAQLLAVTRPHSNGASD